MKKLLYIKASPRAERSHSIAGAGAFVQTWKQSHPDGIVTELDLFEVVLPPLDGLRLQSKYNILHGKDHSDSQAQAWAQVEEVIAQFKEYDQYVFAVPMWNFSIPYRLKHYIDLLVQPGYTFGMNEHGYFGLLEGKKAFVSFSSGGMYEDGNPLETFDFQSTYLTSILGFMGIVDVSTIRVDGTLQSARDERKQAALAQAQKLAQEA